MQITSSTRQPYGSVAIPPPQRDIPPARYLQMRRLARPQDSAAQIFLREAAFMWDFEDHFPAPERVLHYFPTYETLSIPELRGYFSWRGQWRRGVRKKTHLSYAFLHIYELLCGTGCSCAEESFRALRTFYESYLSLDPGIGHYCRLWLRDLVLCDGLDAGLLAGVEDPFDAAVACLADPAAHSPKDTLVRLSKAASYDLCSSRLTAAQPEETATVLHEVLLLLQTAGFPLADYAFGPAVARIYTPFSSAVVPRRRCPDGERILGQRRFFCRDGVWRCEERLPAGRSKPLGALLRFIDARLRRELGLRPALQEPTLPPACREAVEAALSALRRRKEDARRAAVSIEPDRLPRIRLAANRTRDSLIVPDAEEEIEPPPPPTPCRKTEADAVDTAFLAALLRGEDPDPILRKSGCTAALAADRVNQQFFDVFSDNIIDFEDNRPVLIADYITELKGMISL